MRRRQKLHHDLAGAARQAFARAQVERHSLPAPVVDEQAHGGAGRRPGLPADARLQRVPLVLSGHHVPARLRPIDAAHGAQQLHLLVAQRVGLETARRLDRDEAQERHQVILEHVAQHPGAVVVRSAILDPLRFGHRDLHVIDEIAIPERLEHAVREAEHQDVLDRLLAEIVVDAEHLGFAEGGQDLEVEGA